MTPSRPRRARGFTLIEMLSALAVSSIILLALAGTVIAQSRAYEVNARTRESIAGGRRSLGFLDAKLRLAGFGIHPEFAFDFSSTRDRTDAPDEVVIRHRDPYFRRRGTLTLDTGVPQTTLTLTAGLPAGGLTAGQILMLICPDGGGAAYVSLAADAAAGATALTLAAYDGTTFPRQLPTGCLLGQDAASRPFVVRIDELRFFVDASATLTMRRAGANVPIATGVEDFQVSYLMNRPQAAWFAVMPDAPDALGDSDWEFGDVEGTVEEPSPAAVAPTLANEYRHANRFTAHPANIRALRITLVARSDREFVPGERRPAAHNRAAATSTDGFYRAVLSRQIPIPNMLTRSVFAPVNLNLGGS